jgi:hypothetical protein
LSRHRLVTLFVLFAYGEAPLTPEAVLRVASEMAERRAESRAAQPAPPRRESDLAPADPDGPPLSNVNFSSIERGERFVVAVSTTSILLPPPSVFGPCLTGGVEAPVVREELGRPRPRGPPSFAIHLV